MCVFACVLALFDMYITSAWMLAMQLTNCTNVLSLTPYAVNTNIQVYSMRETHDELCELLGQHEAQSLGAAEVFTPLAHLPVLQVSVHACVCLCVCKCVRECVRMWSFCDSNVTDL